MTDKPALTKKAALIALYVAMLGYCGTSISSNEKAIEFRGVDGYGVADVAETKTVVVKDEESWSELWDERRLNQRGSEVPKVDFAREMVIGVYLGGRPDTCNGISIQRVLEDHGIIIVEYKESRQFRAVCGLFPSYPSSLVAIPLSNLPVNFVKQPGLIAR